MSGSNDQGGPGPIRTERTTRGQSISTAKRHLLWSYFHDPGTKWSPANRTDVVTYCKSCVRFHSAKIQRDDELRRARGEPVSQKTEEELVELAFAQADRVKGAPSEFAKHILSCKHVDKGGESYRTALAYQTQPRARRLTRSASSPSLSAGPSFANHPALATPSPPSTPIAYGQSYLPTTPSPLGLGLLPEHSSNLTQKELEKQLLKGILSAGMTFHMIEDPEIRLFLQRLNESTETFRIPSRTRLSGPIMDSVLEEYLARKREAAEGGLATSMCDGWDARNGKKLQAMMFQVNGDCFPSSVFNVGDKRKTGEFLFDLMKMEKTYIEDVLKSEMVAFVSDAGGDSAKARRLFQKEFPHIITLDCVAHQLVLGDYIKLDKIAARIIDDAAELTHYINHHSYISGLFYSAQRKERSQVLTLIRGVITRWASHVIALERLLKMLKYLRWMVADHREEIIESVKSAQDKAYAATILDLILTKDETDETARNFEKDLQNVKDDLAPLAVAINVCQGSQVRGDHVGVVFGRMLQLYTKRRKTDKRSPSPLDGLIESILKRWKAICQEFYIACMILNPWIKLSLFKPSIAPIRFIDLLVTLYARIMRVPSPSPELTAMRKDAAAYIMSPAYDVFGGLSSGRISRSSLSDSVMEDNNPALAWRTVCDPTSPLARFAARLFSVTSTSANVERLFSTYGNTLTARQNKLSLDRASKSVEIRLALKREHALAGLVPKRVKRSFGIPVTDATINALNSRRLDEEDMLRKAAEAADDSPSDEVESTSPRPARENSRKWREEMIRQLASADSVLPATANIFDAAELFNLDLEEEWQVFWLEGEANRDRETELLDLLTRTEQLTTDPQLAATAGWSLSDEIEDN